MKKLTKILVSLMVVAAIAACGQARGARSSSDQAKQDALGSTVDTQNTDIYRFAVGNAESTTSIPATTLYTTYGVNPAGLGISIGTGATFVDVDIAVEKTTLRCGMDVKIGADTDTDGIPDIYHFEGTATAASGANITCTLADAFSTVNVQIFPQGVTALVTIIDMYSASIPFMTNKSFSVNPKEVE